MDLNAPRGSFKILLLASAFFPFRPLIMSFSAAAADAMASSMETVESLAVLRDEVDSDKEWEKVTDEVELARATLVHNLEAHTHGSNEVSNCTAHRAVHIHLFRLE